MAANDTIASTTSDSTSVGDAAAQYSLDFQWKALARLDSLLVAANTKAAVLLTFETFVVGTMVLKASDVLEGYEGFTVAHNIASLVLIGAAIAAVVAAFRLVMVIAPFLDSADRPGDYNSTLFFQHVARFQSAYDYHEWLQETLVGDEKAQEKDLALQTHALATGLTRKFNNMDAAVNVILWWQLPMLSVLLITKVCILFTAVCK